MASIASILNDCLKRFNNLIASNVLQQDVIEVPLDSWEDELGRLRVWAANIGAHQSGRSSLDYRLRDASNIRDQITRLLRGLRRAFDDLDDVLQELEGRHIPVEDDSESEDTYGSEVQQIFTGLVNTIDCLFQMSMVVRRPTQHDRFMGAKKADSAPFEPYDQQHVCNKFPQADQEIINRLGTAISRRRAGLRYRERHRAKMSKGLNSTLGNQPETGSTTLSETVATELMGNQDVQLDETASNSGLSQTSYAQSLVESNDRISIPSPPKESADKKPFECPYCFFVITIRDERSWVQHIFTDLMPYVCVFPDCSTPTMLYASRREWYHHLQTSHFVQSSRDTVFDCPLCQEEVTSEVRLDRHVGRHLEELALFALPRTESDQEEESRADAKLEQIMDKSNSDGSDHDDPHLGSSAASPAFSGGIEDWKRTVSEDDIGKAEGENIAGLKISTTESDAARKTAIADTEQGPIIIYRDKHQTDSSALSSAFTGGFAALSSAFTSGIAALSTAITGGIEDSKGKMIDKGDHDDDGVDAKDEVQEGANAGKLMKNQKQAFIKVRDAAIAKASSLERLRMEIEAAELYYTWYCSDCRYGPLPDWESYCPYCGHMKCYECKKYCLLEREER